MADTLKLVRFHGCLADPDVWMQKNTEADGTECWEYVLCCMDNVLAISHDP